MKYTRALRFIFCLFLITVQKITPYMGSLTYYRKHKKKVLVIGDWHFKNHEDKRDFKLIKRFIADLNKTKKKVCWLHEGNQDIYDEWKYNPDQATITSLLCNAFYHKLNMGLVHFELVDCRYDASRIFTDMLDYCSGFYEDETMADYYNTPNSTMLAQAKLEYVSRMAQDSFATSLITDIDHVLSLVKSVKPLTPARSLNIIEPLNQSLRNAKKEIETFFRKKSKRAIKASLNKAIRTCSVAPLGNLINTRDAIMTDMADAGFIAHFLKNEALYDTFIIFVGDYHTLTINPLLESLGYKKQQEKGAWPGTWIEKAAFPVKTISSVFNSFIGV